VAIIIASVLGAGVAEDVPEQEEEDAGGNGVQDALDRLRDAANPSDRKADEDGGAGDGAQRGGGGVTHVLLVGAKLRIS
jgi:hypothetical protein